MKLCINCKHHLKLNAHHFCSRDAEPTVNLVTGDEYYNELFLLECEKERSFTEIVSIACGEEGRYFAPSRR